MRISKESAKSIAVKMTDKKSKDIDKLRKEISDFAYGIAKSTVKKDVLEFYEKHKGYFNITTTISVSGTGLNFQQLNFSPALPKSDSTCWYITKLVDDKTAKKVVDLCDQKDKAKKELNKLQSDIENALISLGTYARVQEQFKEAAPFLPVKEKAELVVNLNDIRKRI